MDSDFFLIRKMRQGNGDAFDAFIRKYYGDILRYCACRCFDEEDAQDLTQETFVRFSPGFLIIIIREKQRITCTP